MSQERIAKNTPISGEGAFETMLVNQGVALLLEEHIGRLKQTSNFLGINVERRALRVCVEGVLRRRDPLSSYVIKLIVTHHDIGVEARPNPYKTFDKNQKFRLTLSTLCRDESDPFIAHKVLSRSVLDGERQQAKSRGFDEVLFLNKRGEVSEGSVSNLFYVHEQRLCTPPKACGLLPGIVRGWICDNFYVEEKSLTLEKLMQCEELFITNSLMGIMPVKSFDTIALPSCKRADHIRAAYQSMVVHAM